MGELIQKLQFCFECESTDCLHLSAGKKALLVFSLQFHLNFIVVVGFVQTNCMLFIVVVVGFVRTDCMLFIVVVVVFVQTDCMLFIVVVVFVQTDCML